MMEQDLIGFLISHRVFDDNFYGGSLSFLDKNVDMGWEKVQGFLVGVV